MQISDLEALAPGERVRVRLDTGSQVWTKNDDGTFAYRDHTASVTTFTAAVLSDRVETLTNNDLTYVDLPWCRLTEAFIERGSGTWRDTMRDVPIRLLTPQMHTTSTRDAHLVSDEERRGFSRYTARDCDMLGIPEQLQGLYLRAVRPENVTVMTETESIRLGAQRVRLIRAETERQFGAMTGWWESTEDNPEVSVYPAVNAGSYSHVWLAPEGANPDYGFQVDDSISSTYGLPPGLVGHLCQWVRPAMIAPTPEQIAEREAAAARQREWFEEQPKVRVQAGAVNTRYTTANPPTIQFDSPANAAERLVVVLETTPAGTPRNWGFWEINQARVEQFGLPQEMLGMWGRWLDPRYVTEVDPLKEWLDTLVKRRVREGAEEQPAGNYMETRPSVPFIQTLDRLSLFLSIDPECQQWGFWDHNDMRPYIPEEFHEFLGTRLFGWWIAETDTEPEPTPEERVLELPVSSMRGALAPGGWSAGVSRGHWLAPTDGGNGVLLFTPAEAEEQGVSPWWVDERLPGETRLLPYAGMRGWFVEPRHLVPVTEPEPDVAVDIDTIVATAVEEATAAVRAEMQVLINRAQAGVDRLRGNLERVAASLREVLDSEEVEYGGEYDDLLNSLDLGRTPPTDTIWVEVKVEGTGTYEVDDSTIEDLYEHTLTTVASSYEVDFEWERTLRFDDIQVPEGQCVCGEDVSEYVDIDLIRERLRENNTPQNNVTYEIVDCQHG